MQKSNLVGMIENKGVILFALFVYSITNSMNGLVVSFLSKRIINSITGIEFITLGIFFIYLLLFAATLGILFFARYQLLQNSFLSVSQLQQKIYSRMKDIDMNLNQDIGKGNIITYITRDVQVINEFLQRDLKDFVESFCMLIVMSIVCMQMDIRVYAFTMLCSITYAATIFFIGKIRECDEKSREEHRGLVNDILSIYKGLPIFHLFTGMKKFLTQFENRLVTIEAVDSRRSLLNGIYNMLAWGSNMVREIGIIVFCPLVLKLDYGTTMALILISSYLNSTLTGLGESLIGYQRVKIAGRNITEALSMPVEELQEPISQTLENIELRNVSFSYGSNKEALRQISLTIPFGEMIGVTGEIGSGKSTLCKLLLGLYSPQKGEILLNQRPLRTEDRNDLRQFISYVDQDSNLFEGSLRDNLTAFDNGISDDTIWEMLDRIKVSDWVKNLPKGLDTEVGQRGITVSGGERQRISVARALLRKSTLLIIDEPTSALDPDNEAAIRTAIANEKGSRTIIVVSHRKESLHDADRIIRLSGGALESDQRLNNSEEESIAYE